MHGWVYVSSCFPSFFHETPDDFSILITSLDPTWRREITFLSRKLKGHTQTTSHYSSTDESQPYPYCIARVILSPLRPQMVMMEHGEGAVCAVTHYVYCYFCG